MEGRVIPYTWNHLFIQVESTMMESSLDVILKKLNQNIVLQNGSQKPALEVCPGDVALNLSVPF